MFGIFSLAWFLMLALSVFALGILARSERQLVDDRFSAKEKMLIGTEAGELKVELAKLAAEIKAIEATEQVRVLPVGFLQKVLISKPAGVKINGIFFARGISTDSEAVIELSGAANNRRSLLAFLEQLRADKSFTAVDSPVSNLIKENNVDFSLKLRLTNRHE